MRKILAPHKEQDGWVYVRVQKVFSRWGLLPWRWSAKVAFGGDFGDTMTEYHDTAPEHRIISSRRVEGDVETGDYLRLCAEEGLAVKRTAYARLGEEPARVGRWAVANCNEIGWCYGDTLREAYHRYHAAKPVCGDAT